MWKLEQFELRKPGWFIGHNLCRTSFENVCWLYFVDKGVMIVLHHNYQERGYFRNITIKTNSKCHFNCVE